LNGHLVIRAQAKGKTDTQQMKLIIPEEEKKEIIDIIACHAEPRLEENGFSALDETLGAVSQYWRTVGKSQILRGTGDFVLTAKKLREIFGTRD